MSFNYADYTTDITLATASPAEASTIPFDSNYVTFRPIDDNTTEMEIVFKPQQNVESNSASSSHLCKLYECINSTEGTSSNCSNGKYSDHNSNNSMPSQPKTNGYQHFETPAATNPNVLPNIDEKATPTTENTILALSSSDIKTSLIDTDIPPRHIAPTPILDKEFRPKTSPHISLTWSDETHPDKAIFNYLIDMSTAKV